MLYLGLDKDKIKDVVQQLNSLLANYHVYYQNLRNFHWNVRGENFFKLHEKFEELYVEAREHIDLIAERILAVEHRPLSSMKSYLEFSSITEAPEITDDREMVATTLNNLTAIIATERKILESAGNAGDEGTIDMVGGFMDAAERHCWMLSAFLRNQEENLTNVGADKTTSAPVAIDV